MLSVKYLGCILALLFAISVPGAVRIAVRGTGHAAEEFAGKIRQQQESRFVFLNPIQLNALFGETLPPEAVPEGVVKTGCSAAFELFAAIDQTAVGESAVLLPSRIRIFEQKKGVRLIDRRLPQDPEAALRIAAQALRDAAELKDSPERWKPVVVTDTEAGKIAPLSGNGVRFVRADFRRQLHYLPGIILLGPEERPRELPAPVELHLTFSPADDKSGGFETTLQLSDIARKLYSGKDRADTTQMAHDLAQAFNIAVPESIPPARDEAHRLYREYFSIRKSHPREAIEKCHAAIALNPGSVLYRNWLLDTIKGGRGLHDTPRMTFELLKQVADLQDAYPENRYFYSYCATAQSELLGKLYSSRLSPGFRRQIRQFAADRRERILPYLEQKLPPDPPGTPDELKLAVSIITGQTNPIYYFDTDAFLADTRKNFEKLDALSSRQTDLDLHDPVRRMLRQLIVKTGSENPELFVPLAQKLINFDHPDFKAAGLIWEFSLKMPIPEEQLETEIADYARKMLELPERCRDPEKQPYWSNLPHAVSNRIAEAIRCGNSRQLPEDDPDAAVNQSPEKLAALIEKQTPSALELHAPKWSRAISGQFAGLTFEELAQYNPDYRFEEIPGNRKEGILIAATDDGRNGFYLVKQPDESFLLNMWDSGLRRVRTLRRFSRAALHIKRPAYSAAVISASGNDLLIGSDDQIIVLRGFAPENPLTIPVEGMVQSLTMHNGRIYAFLGDTDGFNLTFTKLISCLPNGRDMKTHIFTKREKPETSFDVPARPFLAWLLAGIPGKNALIFSGKTNGFGFSGTWEFNLPTGKEQQLLNIAEGRRSMMPTDRAQSWSRQQKDQLFFSFSGDVYRAPGTRPHAFFFHRNLKTGETTAYGWGEEAALALFQAKNLGKELNFEGPFLIENGNFWCAGGKRPNAMAAHLRLEKPEDSPRLIFPAVDAIFPGKIPGSVVVLLKDRLIEIRYQPRKI